MDNCKRKLLAITPWTRSIISSIETWPKCHVFSEWVQNNLTQKNCAGCHQPGIAVRFLLFGEPYNPNTMQTISADARIVYEKVNTYKDFIDFVYNHKYIFRILCCVVFALLEQISFTRLHMRSSIFSLTVRSVSQTNNNDFPTRPQRKY